MRKPDAIALGTVALPFVQFVLLKAGVSLNEDIYYQMVEFDGEITFSFFVSAVVGSIVALVLGSFAYFAAGYPPHICRRLRLLEGVVGFLFFAGCLKNGWSFDFNHCTPESGCDMTSPLKLDFMMCVWLGLPLLWCLMLVCVALFGRMPTESQNTRLERYF